MNNNIIYVKGAAYDNLYPKRFMEAHTTPCNAFIIICAIKIS